jgi:hypothetical protein
MKLDSDLKYLSKEYKYLLEQKFATEDRISELMVCMRPISGQSAFLMSINNRMIEIDERCTMLINPKSIWPDKLTTRKPDNLWDETIDLIKGNGHVFPSFFRLGHGRIKRYGPIHISEQELAS